MVEEVNSTFRYSDETVEKQAPVSEIIIETKDVDDDSIEDITAEYQDDDYQNIEGEDITKNETVYNFVNSVHEASRKHKKRISQCENYRKILVEFYEVHAPQKLKNINFLLERFNKNEIKLMQLIKRVETEYDVTLLLSTVQENTEAQHYQEKKIYRTSSVESFNKSYCNKPKRNVNNMSLNKYKGKMVNCIAHLKNAHQSVHSFIDQESLLFDEYLLDKDYCDTRRRRSSMRNGSPSLTPSSSCESILTRDRLEKFYRVHNPKKLKNVDTLLQKFRGREDKIFKRKEQTYNDADLPF